MTPFYGEKHLQHMQTEVTVLQGVHDRHKACYYVTRVLSGCGDSICMHVYPTRSPLETTDRHNSLDTLAKYINFLRCDCDIQVHIAPSILVSCD